MIGGIDTQCNERWTAFAVGLALYIFLSFTGFLGEAPWTMPADVKIIPANWALPERVEYYRSTEYHTNPNR